MDHPRTPPNHILFSGEPRVVQPTLAHEIDRPVRQCGPHIGGDRLKESPKLSLAESDFLFCPFFLSNIDDCPSELEVIGSGSQRPRPNSNILASIRAKTQTLL